MSFFSIEKHKRRNSTGSLSDLSEVYIHKEKNHGFDSVCDSSNECVSSETSTSSSSEDSSVTNPYCKQASSGSSVTDPYRKQASSSNPVQNSSVEFQPIIHEEHHYHPVVQENSCVEDCPPYPPFQCIDEDQVYRACEILGAEEERLGKKFRRLVRTETSLAIEEILSVKSEAVSEIEDSKREIYGCCAAEKGSSEEEIEKLRSDINKLTQVVDSLTKILFRTA